MWARGPRVWTTRGPRQRYTRSLVTNSRRGPWVVHTSLARAGPQGCGLVHISTGWRRHGCKHIGSGHTRQIATVDHAEMRGLVTDLTSLRRGAGLSLRSGIGARDARWGILPNAAGIAMTRVLHTGRVCPESMCLVLSPTARSIWMQYVLVSHRLSPSAAPGGASPGARCPR